MYVTPHTPVHTPHVPFSLVDLIFVVASFQVFRPYAKHWLGPLLQLVVSGNNGGEGIHFMVVDIVVTVLSWTSLASPKVANPFISKTNMQILIMIMSHFSPICAYINICSILL